LNKGHIDAVPRFTLADRFASLVAHCETTTLRDNKVVNVQAEPDAQHMLDQFDEYATTLINKSDKDVIRQLWNRAHIKALKLSALIAVGVNMIVPTITVEHVEWAIKLIRADIKALSHKFEKGEIGSNTQEMKQLNELTRIIKEFITCNWEHAGKYIENEKMHFEKVIPYLFISKRLTNNLAFKSDRVGATNAIKRAIQTLIDRDRIREMPRNETATKFGTSQKVFIITHTSLLND